MRSSAASLLHFSLESDSIRKKEEIIGDTNHQKSSCSVCVGVCYLLLFRSLSFSLLLLLLLFFVRRHRQTLKHTLVLSSARVYGCCRHHTNSSGSFRGCG